MALKLHQGPAFIDGMVNTPEVVAHTQNKFREGRSNSVVAPETIDTMRQLIFHDHHVTYREIETTLGISASSTHSILHAHLTVKKFFSRWIPHNLSIA